MQTHVKVLGVLFLICAALTAFMAAAIPLGLSLVGALAGRTGDPDAAAGIAILGIAGAAAAALLGVVALVYALCGYGVLTHKPWARIFAIILCAVGVFKFPFGTALGIYGFWIMFNKETEAIFTKS